MHSKPLGKGIIMGYLLKKNIWANDHSLTRKKRLCWATNWGGFPLLMTTFLTHLFELSGSVGISGRSEGALGGQSP
jgi:hypothetical protein